MMGHGFILLFVHLTLHGIDVCLTLRGIMVRLAPRDNPNAIDVHLTLRGIAVRFTLRDNLNAIDVCLTLRGIAVCLFTT